MVQVVSLIYGGDYHLFNPRIDGVKPDEDQYDVVLVKRMYKFFGPFPDSLQDCQILETLAIMQ
jgi:hypothetical protein